MLFKSFWQIFFVQTFIGIIIRDKNDEMKLDININGSATLYLFVENTGRFNFGYNMFDAKVKSWNLITKYIVFNSH